jgi:hypothetical protein
MRLLLFLSLLAVVCAKCSGNTVFCTLIKTGAACTEAGCEFASDCKEPLTGAKPTCARIATNETCLAARCIWSAVTTRASDATATATDEASRNGTTRESTGTTTDVIEPTFNAALVVGITVGTMLIMVIAMVVILSMRRRRAFI